MGLDHVPVPELWTTLEGSGSPTVVFEAGGGDDSSVWSELAPAIGGGHGVRTMVYDRAGLGRSGPMPGPYRIDDEATGLRQALDRHGIERPIVIVAHSYGGFVATLVAATDARVAGLVLLDANLVGFFDDAQLDRLLATYSPRFPELEERAPELARVMIPLLRAYPDTVRRLREVELPIDLPVVDVVAETTWVDTPEEIAAMRLCHEAFVSASPAREAMFAEGSGHYVFRDRPDVVRAAVARVIELVRTGSAPSPEARSRP